jgi:hypothetical protein
VAGVVWARSFLVVAAVVGGGGHVWTCHDGGRGNGRGGHPSSLGFFVTGSLYHEIDN